MTGRDPLTDPAEGDWLVSPDGRAFVCVDLVRDGRVFFRRLRIGSPYAEGVQMTAAVFAEAVSRAGARVATETEVRAVAGGGAEGER